MIKVIAKKQGKYRNKRIQKGVCFEITSSTDFSVEWMQHAPNQTKEAAKQIIEQAKSIRNGIKHD